MDRDRFIEQLAALVADCMSSTDPAVYTSAGMLVTLQGALLAGDSFLKELLDANRAVCRKQAAELRRIVSGNL